MPCSPAKARLLLKEKKALVKRRAPFTIQLTQATGEVRQPVTLGVDAGSKYVGLSASTEKAELYASEVVLRTDVVDLVSSRRELRRGRRNRKTRYRAPRFNNRVHGKNKGWLAPSVENKINAHLSRIDAVRKLLPVTKIVVETAAFDIQRITNPDIEGTDYQQGEQLGFWNIREYVLFRDGHRCCHCRGKSNDPILTVHHLESRKTGGNAPNNLITLCETCHKACHAGKIVLMQQRGQRFRDAAFMGIMRWTFFNRLKAQCSEIEVQNTYGYLTKNARIRHGLEKTHRTDAFTIAGNFNAERLGEYFFQKQTRKHNRQLHKLTILKGGVRKRQHASYKVRGFRLFDKVRYGSREAFIFGRRSSGYFDIRLLTGEKISPAVSHKHLRLLERRKTFLTQLIKEGAIPPANEVAGFLA